MTHKPPVTPMLPRPQTDVAIEAEATALPRLYLANLTALVVTGVLACGWLLYYTESFQVVGGLLGLGGLFAWVAFVLGLLSETRKKQMQNLFEEQLLLRWRTMIGCVAAIVALAALTAFSGTVILNAEAEPNDRMATVSMPGSAAPLTQTRVPARSVRQLWFFMPFGGTTLRVKLSGLPTMEATVTPPFRTSLSVPTAFLGRPLLLIRPGALRSGSLGARPASFDLLVTVGRETKVLHSYGGQTVWVGTDDDVPVPAAVLQRWREALTISAMLEKPTEGDATNSKGLAVVDLLLTRWASPRAVFSDAILQPGQQVTIAIHRVEDKYPVSGVTAVVRPASAGGAIQEVILE